MPDQDQSKMSFDDLIAALAKLPKPEDIPVIGEHIIPQRVLFDYPFEYLGAKEISLEGNPYFGKIIISEGMADRTFTPTEGFLYHGTNLSALDYILECGVMKTPIQLRREGQLVSGELKRTMDREGDYEARGPKFLSRQAMIQMGMIRADDPHIYEFGHAGDLFFGSATSALSYADEDPTQQAILGIRRSVAEIHGAIFIDGKSEGIIHEGPLSMCMCLQQLLVPKSRVEEYQIRAEQKHLIRVYPIEDLKKG